MIWQLLGGLCGAWLLLALIIGVVELRRAPRRDDWE